MELFYTHITPRAKELALEVLNSGMLSEGEMVKRFEEALFNTFGYRGVAVNSCTSALHLALVLAGVKPGDEVILPAQTFVATGLAVLYCGATPVFVDIEIDTGNIDPDKIAEKVTLKTKAVISVAWGGSPPRLTRLGHICHKYGLKLIQDNAQAFGAKYQQAPIGFYGDFSCFSFQAIKSLTSGDGGFLVCKLDKDHERAKRLRWFGIDRDNDKTGFLGERLYNLTEIGYKYHMNDLSAAVGLGNLDGIQERLRYVEEIANYYNKELPVFPIVDNSWSSNWLYTMLVDKRDDFIRAMRGNYIPVSVVHQGIDKNTVFSSKAELPVQRYWDEHHICIPCHAGLRPEDSWEVVKAIKAGW